VVASSLTSSKYWDIGEKSLKLNTFTTQQQTFAEAKLINLFIYNGTYIRLATACSVAILRGGLGGPWPPQIFAWPPVCPPPSFFLISRLSLFV